MRRLYALAGRSPTIASFGVLAVFAVALTLWFHSTVYVLFMYARNVSLLDLPLQLSLLAVFGVTWFAWMSIHAFGFVGVGSGVGFRLVLLGFVCRVFASMLASVSGIEAPGFLVAAPASIVDLVGWGRNAGLVTYGYGLMLVVLATGADLARRGRLPRWMPAID